MDENLTKNSNLEYPLGSNHDPDGQGFPKVTIEPYGLPDVEDRFVGATVYDMEGEPVQNHLLIDRFGNVMPMIGKSIGAITGNVVDTTVVPSSSWSSGTPQWTKIGEASVMGEEEYFTDGGRWLVTLVCRFAKGKAGVRGIGITSTAEKDEQIQLVRMNVVPAVQSTQTFVSVTAVMDIPRKNAIVPKLIFKAFQTSGEDLKVLPRYTAIRLGDIPKFKELGYNLEQEEHIDPIPQPSWPPISPIFPKPEPITDPIPYPPVVDK